MAGTDAFGTESTSVQTHLRILQDVISRMAENSRACKVWCVTILSAGLILSARVDLPAYVLVSLVPLLAFLLLDAYYLALERAYRGSYDSFVQKLARGELTTADLYVVKPAGSVPRTCLRSLGSFSIYPFYGALAAAVVILRSLI